MWLSAIKLAMQTGGQIYKKRQETKILMADAERLQAEKMAKGELAYTQQITQAQKGDWKDEFCLILISIPLLLLAWSVFSDDPDIQQKIDVLFHKFENLPLFYKGLVVGSFSTILGVRGVSAFKKK